AIFAGWFLVSLFQPFHGNGSGTVIVEIPKGASASKVGSILARDGVVSSGFFFDLRAFLDGKRSSLHSGRFELRRDMTHAAQLVACVARSRASLCRTAPARSQPPYQLLTGASMVEREAQLPAARPRIAAVIYNRLRKGMPLGIDATIYYAIELQKGIATYTG